ncbi:EAL domain-containing protein [Sphingomonas sp. RB3P16]|uniref:putative bifunctional diguanylate cyclase/phosphodiesterase n=1 Tax=Parasphingomonas frigoris TaxID=3096163 RepID=UPI002FC7B31B
MIDFYRADALIKTFVIPAAMCTMASLRAIWWLRQDGRKTLGDAEIARLIRRTCNLALGMTIAFDLWCMSIYELGDAYERGHVTFFLALTQVSSVFCLMSIRTAAMRVAVTSTLAFSIYFSFVDEGRMLVEACVLALVGGGMIIVTHRYNLDFSGLINSQRDLRIRQIEAERLSEENSRIALTDALSGLPNRRALLARLDRLESRPALPRDCLAVMFIDLDGFKEINDAHGHQAGDALIASLSERLRAACPLYAMLARVGGDEFAVLIETDGATAEANALARRLYDEICLPVLVERHILQVSASIGIAGNAEGPLRAHELLRRADTAMYTVKMRGKGEIAAYDVAFDQGRLHRLAIEDQIAKGLANDEFEVFYQPVVEAQSGAIVATEALVRWPRRPAGALEPDDFIDIAEATGQIQPLGLFVLERGCRDVLPLGNLKLSVNVSPAQFRDPAFERQVARILAQTRFPPERLQFEITEGYLLANPERAVRAIDAFKALGMSIALDDFGTGFTSIQYLQSYGFCHIKIDKSLVVGLHADSKASMLIAGAIFLAIGLDMRIIAEGVETEEQAMLLRLAGCHKLQGYLFGRPTAFADFLAKYRAQETLWQPAKALRISG